jgi:hypothetical protein
MGLAHTTYADKERNVSLDRLPRIKAARLTSATVSDDDVEWLIEEVDRMRAIADTVTRHAGHMIYGVIVSNESHTYASPPWTKP